MSQFNRNRYDLDNQQIYRLKHCIRLSGERFAEDVKMLKRVPSTDPHAHLAAQDLAATFEQYVEECQDLANLLEDADSVTLVRDEAEVRN
jgi:hypothetical protein